LEEARAADFLEVQAVVALAEAEQREQQLPLLDVEANAHSIL
jgi:hypothetical protein